MDFARFWETTLATTTPGVWAGAGACPAAGAGAPWSFPSPASHPASASARITNPIFMFISLRFLLGRGDPQIVGMDGRCLGGGLALEDGEDGRKNDEHRHGRGD